MFMRLFYSANCKHFFPKAALLLALFALGAACAPSALANTLYSYTGTPYTGCVGTYALDCSSHSLTGSFDTTFSLPQLENLNNFVIPTADIVSFSFTDGFEASLNQNTSAYSFVEISTDSHGDITSWAVLFLSEVLPTNGEITGVTALASVANAANVVDVSGIDFTFDCTPADTPLDCPLTLNDAGITNESGVWSPPGIAAPTPEPPPLFLLGTGLLGLGLFIRRLA